MKKTKKYLTENLWNRANSDYYKIGEEDNLKHLFKTPIYKSLLKYKNVWGGNLLDVGCGDGSKTSVLFKEFNFNKGFGVDISKYAIDNANSKYKYINFIQADIEELNYIDNFFDVVITNFVMEHTSAPARIINEMLRVCKKGGYIAILCPNYGAPNRCSPPYKGSRVIKLLKGVLYDLNPFNRKLNWIFVEPLSNNKDRHTPDYDTTVEPNLHSTIKYIKTKNIKVDYYSSVWEADTGGSIYHKFIRILGIYGFFPFKYWGPQHLLVIKKI